jgi:polyisoprenoid-binding protein YceI
MIEGATMSDTTTASLTREFNGAEVPLAGRYTFDPGHSSVSFSVRHMMVSKVRGYFAAPEGEFVVGENPLDSSVTVEIDWASVTTGEPKRDEHLRSPDFFHVEKFPTISYRSTGVRQVKGDKWALDGMLTVQEVSKPVTLDLEFNGASKDPWGNVKAGFSGSTKIDREDFGLSYNAILETGGVLVGKEVTIDIDVEAKLEA